MSHLLCCCSSLAVVVCTTRAKAHQPTAGSAMHSGPKLLKTAKIKFTWCNFSFSADSHNFRFRSSCALHIQNLSNCCRDKYYPSISRFFGGFSLFGPLVRQCHGVDGASTPPKLHERTAHARARGDFAEYSVAAAAAAASMCAAAAVRYAYGW